MTVQGLAKSQVLQLTKGGTRSLALSVERSIVKRQQRRTQEPECSAVLNFTTQTMPQYRGGLNSISGLSLAAREDFWKCAQLALCGSAILCRTSEDAHLVR